MVTTLGEGEIFSQPYKCTGQLKTQYDQIKGKERITTGFYCLDFGDITHIRILLLQNMSHCSTHSEICIHLMSSGFRDKALKVPQISILSVFVCVEKIKGVKTVFL